MSKQAVAQSRDIRTWWCLNSELALHDIPNVLHRIKIRQVRWPGHEVEFISMLLEPLQHNPSLVTWGVVLLEDSISSWEDKRHVRVQLIRNDVQIVRSFQGLFYHNYGSRATHENVPQSIIPPLPACVWPAVQEGSNCSLGRRPTLTRPST
ncbi:hypothetical protein AVEN_83368-1 [Araneus ventricosus]|uniref:Uncharacterized protein n=1 Tax=Araneus ventricosus TaxID=182803 RepID=A0A4Y2QM03_ARAVE|nr:hypothetical protein AVEN_83368-1 [Araneus ventricosus]